MFKYVTRSYQYNMKTQLYNYYKSMHFLVISFLLFYATMLINMNRMFEERQLSQTIHSLRKYIRLKHFIDFYL